MSGETSKQVSGWTTDTLKMYTDDKFVAIEKLVQASVLSSKEAVTKAEIAAEKAFLTAIESSKEAIAKAETATEKRFESVNEFRKTLTDQTATFIPRNEADRVTGSNSEKIQQLADRLNRIDAQGEGSKITMGKLAAALAAAGTIISIAVVVLNQVINAAYRTTAAQTTSAAISPPAQGVVADPRVIPLKK